MLDLGLVLKRLVEIGIALGREVDPKHPEDVNRLRGLIVEAQDIVLRMEKQALGSSVR